MAYLFYGFLLSFIVFVLFFYVVTLKYYQIYRFNSTLDNSLIMERLVREIVTKACIISILDHRDTKMTPEEKEHSIIEKAAAISADVLLQHNIEPKNYDLHALAHVEIFRLNARLIQEHKTNGKN